MKAVLALFLIVVCSACYAADPSLTCELSISGGYKYYVYTLSNGSSHSLDGFKLGMSEDGARGVVSLTGPSNWYVERYL